MHDHDHSHEPEVAMHTFGKITPYEGTLFHRSQVMHVATEIYKSGVPKGRVTPMAGEDTFFTPKEAVEEAIKLVEAIDDHIISCRIEESDQSITQ